MKKNPLVAVISPFHNAQNHVEEWLSCFRHQTSAAFIKLYLTDDASTDNTLEKLRHTIARWRLAATVLASPINRGAAGARNLAIRAALSEGADLILLLDSDCRAKPNWIERHVEFHIKHPDIKVLGGAIEGISQSPIGKADGFASWFPNVPYSRSGYRKKLHLSSTNMSIKSEVFLSIGYFDDDLHTGEDVAFCRKLQKAGHYPYFQSDIVVYHLDRNERLAACRHHYRWGLHSFNISLRDHGGYFNVLNKFKNHWWVLAMVPLFTLLTTTVVILQYSWIRPSVWLYLPWLLYLKWWNAVGVYHGYRDPSLCVRGCLFTENPPADKSMASG